VTKARGWMLAREGQQTCVFFDYPQTVCEACLGLSLAAFFH